MGNPAKRNDGSDIRPPPPAMESIMPARKTIGQTIMKAETDIVYII